MATYKARTGSLKVDFVPLRRDEVATLQRSFGVEPDFDADALQALVDAPGAPGPLFTATSKPPMASPSPAGWGKTFKVLSVDFVREGKAAPKEKGQYFGLNAAEASARLGAPLTSGSYRIAHLRTGLESEVRIWAPVGAGVSDNYTTVGNAMGRWEPLGSVPHQWHLGDELRFVTGQAPSPPATAAATAGGPEAAAEAQKRVLAFMEGKTVQFNGA